MVIKSLLSKTDFVLTDGKTLSVIESGPEEATKQQEIMAYENPGQPIYLLMLASVAVVTKKDAKAIKKALQATAAKIDTSHEHLEPVSPLSKSVAKRINAQKGNNNVH